MFYQFRRMRRYGFEENELALFQHVGVTCVLMTSFSKLSLDI